MILPSQPPDERIVEFNPVYRLREHFETPQPSLRSRLATLYALAFPPARVKGVDISRWQTITSFTEMKAAGYEFVIVKATEHVSWVDPKFSEFWPRVIDAGMILMVYHFFRSNYSGTDQADFHLETIQPAVAATGGRIISWCDLETADGVTVTTRRIRWRDFSNYIYNNFKKGGTYSSPYLWRELMNDMPLGDNFGWDAHWTPAANPTLPTGWTEDQTRVWQRGISPTHAWLEKVPGLTGAIDVDAFFGTMDELRTFVGYEAAPPPVPAKVKANIALLNLRPIPSDAAGVYILGTTTLGKIWKTTGVQQKDANGRGYWYQVSDDHGQPVWVAGWLCLPA